MNRHHHSSLRTFFLGSLLCGNLAACQSSSSTTSAQLSTVPRGATENEIFDATRTTPVKLLRDMYENHRFLVIGHTSHGHETQYQMLDSLLQQIGQDPRLKVIVLERSFESAPLLEELSTHEIPPAEFGKHFPTKRAAQMSLCGGQEWAYTWSTFLPRIRALNAQRPATNKLHVTTVDAVTFVPLGAADAVTPALLEGERRETGTGANFKQLLWNTLGPTDKAIVIYAASHVIKTFTVLNTAFKLLDDGTLPSDTAPNGSIARVPSNWMSTFLRDTPAAEAQIGIVLLEQNASGHPDPDNTSSLKFTQRQVARYPNQAFGVPLAPFRNVLTAETGVTVFPNNPSGPYGSGEHSSSALPAMIDGVIRLPQTKQWALKQSSDYLPEVCPP